LFIKFAPNEKYKNAYVNEMVEEYFFYFEGNKKVRSLVNKNKVGT